MWDVAAWITYHIARANVNIASCDTMPKTANEPLPATPPANRASALRLRSQAK